MSKYLRRGLNWYASLWPKRLTKPPFSHIVQLGDPVLRQRSEDIPISLIKSNEIKRLIYLLSKVMKMHNSLGLSAPQIGVNKRVFVMELSQYQIKDYEPKVVEEREISIIPFTVLINPEMKILSQHKVTLEEGCESIKGYKALVPRFKEVSIKGWNENGEQVNIQLRGWSARIAQHEMDHLDGKVYTDIMNQQSFSCICWKEINIHKGKIELPYYPS